MTETDILIIGGGIAGCATAWALAEGKHDVTVLERGEIASEASGVNAGSIGGIGWGHMPNLESHLTMGSLELFKQLQLDHGYDVEFRQSGTLQAIHDDAQYAFARDHVLQQRERGYTLELLSSREARSLEPEWNPALCGAIYAPLRAQADPQKATRAFAAAAARSGAHVFEHRPLLAIHAQGDGAYRVETADGELRAGALVIAAGAWCAPIGELLGMRIPIVPVRGQMWATAALPPRAFHTISSVESMLHWHATPGNDDQTPPHLTHAGTRRLTRHLYGRQRRNGQVIFGGDRQWVGFDKQPDPAGIEVNRAHAAEVLPFLSAVPLQRTWAGLMPFSLDGAPLIGKIPQRDNLYIVSGLASSGFGRGPMAGKLLADYIHSGQRPPVLAEADPARCVTEIA